MPRESLTPLRPQEPGPAAWQAHLHRVIFGNDTPAGRGFDLVLLIVILASVLVASLETVAALRQAWGGPLRAAEWAFTLVFTVEYGLRLACLRRPGAYARSFFGVVDLLAVLPTWLSLLVPGAQALMVVRAFRLLRMFRVLKLSHYFGESLELLEALARARRKIVVFLVAVLGLVLTAGSVLYVIEGDASGFSSLPVSFYWAIVTVTTVGYGDIAPQSPLGQLVASLLMLTGYGIIAVPTGIVTTELVKGQAQVKVPSCPGCGSPAADDHSQYCHRCGSRLGARPARRAGVKRRTALLLALLLPGAAQAVTARVDAARVLGTIPDLTYGSNQPLDAPVKLRRHGGNRWTGYNWEINASNAGHDWHHTSDYWLNTEAGLPNSPGLDPAALVLRHLLRDKEAGAASLVTVPMAGYVAADGSGKVGEEPAPNARWVKVIPRKGRPFSDPPNLEDGRVYVDEFVDHLHRRWGRSGNGVRYFSLDNEPALWHKTHPRIHPLPASYRSLLDRSVATAAAILDLDPGAEIVGPALYGWQAARKLQDAPDSAAHNKDYDWFVSYYLDQMKKAGEAQGRRLLHWFDLHWYPEARGAGLRITDAGNNTQPELVEARVQAPRSLWDPDYVETSWIADDLGKRPITLIPRLRESVERWYPGTGLAFAEFSYGGGNHISGALAVADALGVFGKHGALASHWSTSPSETFTSAAYRLYLDYDGQGGRFGDRALHTEAGDNAVLSVHAAAYSTDPKRWSVLVIHKGQSAAAPLSLELAGMKPGLVRAWRLQGGAPAIKPSKGEALTGVMLRDSLPPLSATLYLLSSE